MNDLGTLIGRTFVLTVISCIGLACASEEVCDWEDNDRDGIIDEGFDADGDGSWLCGISQVAFEADEYDCDDDDPNVHPLASEACDVEDNDCDGIIDNGCAVFALEESDVIAHLFVSDIDGDLAPDISVFSGSINSSSWSVSVLDWDDPFASKLITKFDWVPGVCLDLREGYANNFLVGYFGGFIPVQVSAELGAVVDFSQFHELWPETLDWPINMVPSNEDGEFFSITYSSIEGIAYLHLIEPDANSYRVKAQYSLPSTLDVLADLIASDIDGDGIDEVIIVYERNILVLGLNDRAGFTLLSHWYFDKDIGQVAVAHGNGDLLPELYITIPDTWQLLQYLNIGGSFEDVPTELALLRNPLGVVGIDLDGDGDLDLAVSDGFTDSVAFWESSGSDGLRPLSCEYAVGPSPNKLTVLKEPSGGVPKLAISDKEAFALMILEQPCIEE